MCWSFGNLEMLFQPNPQIAYNTFLLRVRVCLVADDMILFEWFCCSFFNGRTHLFCKLNPWIGKFYVSSALWKTVTTDSSKKKTHTHTQQTVKDGKNVYGCSLNFVFVMLHRAFVMNKFELLSMKHSK